MYYGQQSMDYGYGSEPEPELEPEPKRPPARRRTAVAVRELQTIDRTVD